MKKLSGVPSEIASRFVKHIEIRDDTGRITHSLQDHEGFFVLSALDCETVYVFVSTPRPSTLGWLEKYTFSKETLELIGYEAT